MQALEEVEPRQAEVGDRRTAVPSTSTSRPVDVRAAVEAGAEDEERVAAARRERRREPALDLEPEVLVFGVGRRRPGPVRQTASGA